MILLHLSLKLKYMSFRRSLCFLILSALLIFSNCTEKPVADMIISNGKVYTVNEAQPWAEALAIKDGRIMKVGTNDEIQELNGESTEVIDANGEFVIPGLIEGHGHYSSLGRSLMNLNFINSKNWDEIVEMVKEKVDQSKPGDWIIGRGWHQEKWDEQPHNHTHGYPNHYELSAISPDNPVLLTHASGHGVFANEHLIKMAGVNPETPNPVGGEVVRDAQGRAIGVFEERAMRLVRDTYNEYLRSLDADQKYEEWLEGIRLAEEECLSKGITSFQDAGASFKEIADYTSLAENNDMKVRLWAMLRHNSETMKGKAHTAKVIDAGNGYFTCRAIKSELDGALGAFGAWLLEPYNDKPDFVGQNTTTVEEVKAIAEIALESDMQLCVHAIGDKANRETLNVMEETFRQVDNDDLRWRIEHSQHIDPQDIPRFAELGVIASMQGIHCTSDAPFVVKRLGEKRAREGAYPWRSLLDAGAIVTNGTDVPVENADPIPSFYASVTRKRIDNGMEFFTEQSMTREEAIYSYTMANAIAAFEEESKGSLEEGKYADIVILSENWMECTDAEILDTKVLYTIVDGKVRYQG
jgi:predicted amidohydrolase YtcJ